MYGNIQEWTLDNFYLYELQTPKHYNDPLYRYHKSMSVMVRGGGFLNGAKFCRSSSRSVMDKDNPFNDEVGFRIVISLKNERTFYDNNIADRN